MRLKTWWNNRSLFTRYFIFVFSVLTLVVGGVEIYIEGWVGRLLEYGGSKMHNWHEAVIWGVSILIPSLLGGYILAKSLSGRLKKIARMAQSLSSGQLETRLPEVPGSQDDFNKLIHSFNHMADSLSRLIRNERKLLLDISHELRSPLSRLNLAAVLIQQAGGQEESAELAARMEKEIEYMGFMVDRLLSQGKTTLNVEEQPESVQVDSLLAELADNFSFQGKADNKKIQSRLDKNIGIYGKQTLLTSMFSNVMANALFYTPSDSTVLLQAVCGEDELSVKIRDFGPGVPEPHLEDIFRPFYRLDDSRSRGSGGVGLGLALAKEAAFLHGGSISAENAHPGLEVTITLPLYFNQQ